MCPVCLCVLMYTCSEQTKRVDEKMQPVDYIKEENDGIEHQDSSIVFASVQHPSTSSATTAGSMELNVQQTKPLSDSQPLHPDVQVISAAHKDLVRDDQLASCSSRLTISQKAPDNVESTQNMIDSDPNTLSDVVSSTVPLTSTSHSDLISSSSSNVDSGSCPHQENVSQHTDIHPPFKFSAKEFVFQVCIHFCMLLCIINCCLFSQAYPLSCLNCKKLKHSILVRGS